MRNKKFFVVLLALLALSLVALQCGAAEPTATPVPPTPTEEEMMEEATATTAPEEEMMEMEPVKVGVMTPLTGALSEFGPNFRNAAELAQKHLAAAGYEIEIVIGDTETSAIPAVETARQLVEVEGVHALAGAASSGVTIPIAESVTIPNQVPQISNASTSPLITNLPADEGQDFLFRTAPSDALQGVVLADLARALGYESVSVLYVNNPYGQGLNDVFRENFEAAGGTVPASVPHDEDPAPTYNAELQQATEGDPQALIALGYTGHATVYLREALEGEFFSNFLFVDGTQSQEIPETVGAAPLEGQCGTAPGSVESSSLEAFNQAYAADYGEPPPLPFITNMYDAVIAAGLAAYEAQVQGEELSSVAVRDHLRSVAAPEGETVGAGAEGMTQALQLIDQGQAINYEGSAGSVDFDENGDVQTPIQIWCYEGGEIVAQQLVAPGEEITGLEMAEEMPAEVSEDAQFTFGMSADAGTLDPALETSANSLLPAFHMYEGLTSFESGTTEPIPALAESWEVSEDGTDWTFHLREGVTFHDGTPFNADAVVYNFNRWWDPEHPQHQEGQFTYWNYMFQGVRGEDSVLADIEKVDDMTVRIQLSRPNASLLNTLAMENFRFASPTAVEEQGEDYGTAEGQAIGTGPFMLEEWVKEDHITFVRNDDYWGELPWLKRIEFRVIPDTSAAFLALQAGEIDGLSLWASPPPDDVEAARQDPELQVVLNPGLNVGYVGLNHAKEWIQDRRVREAIAHAIDKQAIVDTLYPGDAQTANQFLPPVLWGYNEGIDGYEYDPALARQLLDEAIADGVEIPDPAVFYVMPVSRAYYPQPQETGELIQAFLAEVGINAEIRSPAWPDPYLSDLQQDGTKHDLYMLGWVGDNGDPDNFLCVFFCGATTTMNSVDGEPAEPDEEIADLLRDAVATVEFEQRRAMYEQANQMIHDRVIGVPVVHRTPPTLLRANVEGYVPSPVREELTHLSFAE